MYVSCLGQLLANIYPSLGECRGLFFGGGGICWPNPESGDNYRYLFMFNPLNPHDALKHHFTSLKTDLIFPQQRVLERKFP